MEKVKISERTQLVLEMLEAAGSGDSFGRLYRVL